MLVCALQNTAKPVLGHEDQEHRKASAETKYYESWWVNISKNQDYFGESSLWGKIQYIIPICHDTGILNIWLEIATVRHLDQNCEEFEIGHVEHHFWWGPCSLRLVPSNLGAESLEGPDSSASGGWRCLSSEASSHLCALFSWLM